MPPFVATPTKYIFDQTTQSRRLNPNWIAFHQHKREQEDAQANNKPMKNRDPQGYLEWLAKQKITIAGAGVEALPVLSTLQECKENAEWASVHNTVSETASQISRAETASSIGIAANAAVPALTKLMAQYDIPLGMLSKLLLISQLDACVMIIDDSSSMGQNSDVCDPHTGAPISRMQEVHMRLCQFFMFFALLPISTVYIRFMNRKDARLGDENSPAVYPIRKLPSETAQSYLSSSLGMLRRLFSNFVPRGDTPLLETLKQEMKRFPPTSRVGYWLFCDGQPNGGGAEAQAITMMLCSRPNPERSPVMFLSCTSDGDACEWMRECEEAAPFCAECDDYQSEYEEVIADQGAAFPYTFGMHLVRQLVSALPGCEHDLDAIDEGTPLSYSTMCAMLGWTLSESDYKNYFRQLLIAQHKQLAVKKVVTPLDELKAKQLTVWKESFPQFVRANVAADLPAVQAYKRAVLELKRNGM